MSACGNLSMKWIQTGAYALYCLFFTAKCLHRYSAECTQDVEVELFCYKMLDKVQRLLVRVSSGHS